MINITGGVRSVVRRCSGNRLSMASTGDFSSSLDLFFICHSTCWSFVCIFLFLFHLFVLVPSCSSCICILVNFSVVVLALSVLSFLSFTVRGSGSLSSYGRGCLSITAIMLLFSLLDDLSSTAVKHNSRLGAQYTDINNKLGSVAAVPFTTYWRSRFARLGTYLTRSGGEGGCFLGNISPWGQWGGRCWIPDRRYRWQIATNAWLGFLGRRVFLGILVYSLPPSSVAFLVS